MTNTSQSLREATQALNKELRDLGIGMSEERLKEILQSRGLVSFTPINSSATLTTNSERR